MKKNKLIILDRDGVINFDSTEYIKTPEEWLPIPGSLKAIAMLNRKGFKVAIATNQSGIARGYFDFYTLQQIHNKMRNALAQEGGKIAEICFCPHSPDDHCKCRKPKTGLLEEIFALFNIDPKKDFVPFVGDSLKDIEAAKAAFCQPVLVRTGNGEDTLRKLASNKDEVTVVADLLEFAQGLQTK